MVELDNYESLIVAGVKRADKYQNLIMRPFVTTCCKMSLNNSTQNDRSKWNQLDEAVSTRLTITKLILNNNTISKKFLCKDENE